MKKKLMVYILSTLIFIFIVVTTLFVAITNYQYEENAKNELKNNNQIIINLLSRDHLKDQRRFFEENFQNKSIRVTYIDKNGVVLYDSVKDAESMDNHNNRKEVLQARASGDGYSIRYSETVKKNMMYSASVLEDETVIRSAMSIRAINGLEAPYLKYYFIILIFIILLSVFFSLRLSHIIVKPIRDLDFTTSRISKGEFHRRVKIVSNDEIGQLAKNFNQMADRLENTLNEVMEKQNRLSAILQSMDSGVIAVDRRNKIIMINSYAKKIFGIEKDIIGENLLDNIRDFELEDIFMENEGDYREIKIVWPKERELRVKTADIINRSEHIGTVAVVQDITEIKRLENMRTEFVANVSHELKTPLTSIKGFAETLKYVEDVKTREKFLNIIDEEAERLTRLINDILILSDIEQQRENKAEEIEVNKLIQDVYTLIKNTADVKQIKLSIVGETVPNLIGDKDRFKQMLINLVDNAVKYSEAGAIVQIGTSIRKGKCRVWIKDTGVGIAKEQIPRLFERFYRVDKARSRAKGGTGLGLAIVKHIVLSFRGTIEVESILGKGTTFIIEIPYNHKKSKSNSI